MSWPYGPLLAVLLAALGLGGIQSPTPAPGSKDEKMQRPSGAAIY